MLDQPQDAIECYQAALKKDPNNFWCMIGLARSVWEDGDPSGAKEMLKASIRDFPRGGRTAPLYIVLGRLYRTCGETEKALECFDEAVRLSLERIKSDPDGRVLGDDLANALRLRGRYMEASTAYEQSLIHDGRNGSVYDPGTAQKNHPD